MVDPPPDDKAKPGGLQWLTSGDDMLAGFDRAGRPQGLRAFFATTIAASLFIWDIAFTFGAYHTIFYSRLFQIVVVSSVLLLGSIVLRHLVAVRLWSRLLLAVPLLWLAIALIEPLGRASQSAHVLNIALVIASLASVPFTMWALIRVMAPEYFALPQRRLKTAAVSIVVLVAGTGFLVGRLNYRVTTCQQYVVAGDDKPANCRNGPTDPVRSRLP